MTGWLTKAGRFRIEHVVVPHELVRSNLARPKGILHTVEGSFEGGLSVFRKHWAPNFLVGRDAKGKVRILQFIPVGYMAAALENRPGGVDTNREAAVQVEIAGYSKRTRWSPDSEVTAALGALMAELEDVVGIPLQHDDIKRDWRRWLSSSGWFGHIDVPENTHWDPGALDYMTLFYAAVKAKPHGVVKPKPRKLDKLRAYRLVRRANGIPYTELPPLHAS